jgi:hypothetical protein
MIRWVSLLTGARFQIMSAISIPVSRPSGRVIVVANPSLQHPPAAVMEQLGFECQPVTDPYAALAEVCANPSIFHAMVLSLQSLYREELSVIATIKRRFTHLEIWLMHTDGRQAALAEAMRLGADGLLAEDGLHRLATPAPLMDQPLPSKVIGFVGHSSQSLPAEQTDQQTDAHQTDTFEEGTVGEPVLTADELRALLQEQPSMPPSGGRDN